MTRDFKGSLTECDPAVAGAACRQVRSQQTHNKTFIFVTLVPVNAISDAVLHIKHVLNIYLQSHIFHVDLVPLPQCSYSKDARGGF